MAKAPTSKKPAPAEPSAPKPEGFLPWPHTVEELPAKPRSFRIQRLNAFEWQTYVTEDGVELPIGKPDLFEILRSKVSGVMRHEGQADFLAAKKAAAEQAKEPQKESKDAQ